MVFNERAEPNARITFVHSRLAPEQSLFKLSGNWNEPGECVLYIYKVAVRRQPRETSILCIACGFELRFTIDACVAICTCRLSHVYFHINACVIECNDHLHTKYARPAIIYGGGMVSGRTHKSELQVDSARMWWLNYAVGIRLNKY